MNYVPMADGLGITPQTTAPDVEVIGDVAVHRVPMDLPNGKEANVTLRIGLNGPSDAEARHHEFMATVHAPALTESLEQDLARYTEQWYDILGYDKEGQPILRYTGRERELLEMKIINRQNALKIAQQTRQEVEEYQARMQRERHASEARITAAANAKAAQLIEQAEIARRAKQMAARAGVRD